MVARASHSTLATVAASVGAARVFSSQSVAQSTHAYMQYLLKGGMLEDAAAEQTYQLHSS